MSDFLLYSIIASIVLTIVLNLLPQLFPGPARRMEEKVREAIRQREAHEEQGNSPRVRIFFPWKTMLIASLLLTLVVNAIGWFAAG